MENTSEMAVLRSVCEFAFKKTDKDFKSIGKDESKEILHVLEEPIAEIIEGLEESYTELQQKWWEMKVNAVFLLQTQERNGCSRPMVGLQSISYDTYFDMVKAFDWFDSLVEVPCLLETSERFNLYSELTQHIQFDTVTHHDLQLNSSLIGHFLQLAVCDQPIVLKENEIKFHEIISNLMENILQNFEPLESLNEKDLSEFLNRILLLPVLYLDTSNLKFKKRDQSVGLFSKFCVKSKAKVHQMDISKFPCSLWIRSLKLISKSLRAKLDVDFQEAMNTRFFKVNNFVIEMESLCAEFLQIRDTLFENLPEEFNPDKDRLCGLVLSVFEKQQAFSEIEAEERKAEEKSSDSCLRRIETKSPGFEDDIENLFKKPDLCEFENEGYLDLFLKNPTVLFKEEYLYKIVEIYQNSSKQNSAEEETIFKLKKLVYSVFINLPLVLQQKFIVQGYCQDINLQLLSQPEFNSELTVIFNKFTNNSTKEVLQDVMYLLLINVKTTMERLVDAVINNSGQIDTVIQILQCLPDLCKCRHVRNHPTRTLLVRSIDNVITEFHIQKLQEKNFLKFITVVSKDYRYQILQDKNCQEKSVLNIQELVSSIVLSNLDIESLYTDIYPFSLEFTIKLFTTLLEASRDKSYDWLINLNPIVILLLIGDIYNDVVQSMVKCEHFDITIVIRQLLHKLLATMKNPLRKRAFSIDEKHFDWFMNQIEEYDWRIKIVLHKFMSSFVDDGPAAHTQFLKEVITCAIETGDVKLVLEVGVINEEVTATMLNYLDQLSVTQRSLLSALLNVIPKLLSTEWPRLEHLVVSICHRMKAFSLRLLYIGKVVPQHLLEVHADISCIQVINDAVLFLSTYLPANILQYILRCYTGLVQFNLSQKTSTKDPPRDSWALFLAELFCYLSVTMTMVDREHRETLFVSLLDIIAELKKYDNVRSATRENYESAFDKTIDIIEDEQMAETLVSRLDDIFL